MLNNFSPFAKRVRYYNREVNGGPEYFGGEGAIPSIHGLGGNSKNGTTVKMWDAAHEYGHLFEDS